MPQEFHMLAAGSLWKEPALKVAFHQALTQDVFTELACQDNTMSLDSLFDLAIWLDNLMHNCQGNKGAANSPPNPDHSEPIQLGQTKPSPSELEEQWK